MARFSAGTDSHGGIFQRTGVFAVMKRGRYAGKERERIEQLHGPSVVQMLDNEEIRDAIIEGATERFSKSLDQQVKHLLDKNDKL